MSQRAVAPTSGAGFPHYRMGLLLAALLLAVLSAVGCSDPNGDGEQMLADFCAASTKACNTVSQGECVQIVKDANKMTTDKDISCAKAATDCGDAKFCLDQMSDGQSSSSQPKL